MSKISREDKALYQRVDEVTHYVWDPIGVAGAPQARDEYDRYIWPLVGRVKTGSLEEVVKYMKVTQTETMGLPFEEERAIEAADIMIEWNEFLNENT